MILKILFSVLVSLQVFQILFFVALQAVLPDLTLFALLCSHGIYVFSQFYQQVAWLEQCLFLLPFLTQF